ncbi:MAG: helix-turn-helix domain-containing protein [bacterium]
MKNLAAEYEEVFTVSEFARLFKLSASAVRTLIRQRQINAIKIGGSYRIPRQIVDNFFSQANLKYEDVLEESFGMWEDRKDIPDGVEYVRKLRDK